MRLMTLFPHEPQTLNDDSTCHHQQTSSLKLTQSASRNKSEDF